MSGSETGAAVEPSPGGAAKRVAKSVPDAAAPDAADASGSASAQSAALPPEPAAAVPVAPVPNTVPAPITVGDTVRLVGGQALVVRGVRVSPFGVHLLGPGEVWFDGAGASKIASGS